MERNARKGAVKSLLQLSDQAFSAYYNRWLELCWDKFGRDEFGKLGQEYINSDGNPEALRQSARDGIYSIVEDNADLVVLLDSLEETLTELIRIAGWDLDPRLLQTCLDARISIGALRSTKRDDEQVAKNGVTEHIMDIGIHTTTARNLLMELAGISDDD